MKPLVHQTELFVDRLCERISSGERAPGIPVRLWRRGGGTNALPQRIPMKLTVRNLIIVIVDQAFFEARKNQSHQRLASEWGVNFLVKKSGFGRKWRKRCSIS